MLGQTPQVKIDSFHCHRIIAPVSFVSIDQFAPSITTPCYKFQKGEPLYCRALQIYDTYTSAAWVSWNIKNTRWGRKI
jgi:hypothetical protein